MVNETTQAICLTTDAGKVQNLNQLESKISTLNPAWYWYEPDIAAHIGQDDPVQTLKKYSNLADLPDKKFTELMLFGKTAGMTILKEGTNQLSYFYWQEVETKHENTITCHKAPYTAYRRDTEQAQKQYSHVKLDDLPKNFSLNEYLQNNQRIAWTITDITEG